MAKRNKKQTAQNLRPFSKPSMLVSLDPVAAARKELMIKAMEEQAISMNQLAKKAGMSYGMLQSFANGEINLPPDLLGVIAAPLHLGVPDLQSPMTGKAAEKTASNAEQPGSVPEKGSETAGQDGPIKEEERPAVEVLKGADDIWPDVSKADSCGPECGQGGNAPAAIAAEEICTSAQGETKHSADEKDMGMGKPAAASDVPGKDFENTGNAGTEPAAYVPSPDELWAMLMLCNSRGISMAMFAISMEIVKCGAEIETLTYLMGKLSPEMLASLQSKMWNILMDPSCRKGAPV